MPKTDLSPEELEAKAKAEAEAKVKAEADAKAKAQAEADAKALAEAEEKRKAEPASPGLVTIRKGNETIDVHPSVVGAHEAAGWKLA